MVYAYLKYNDIIRASRIANDIASKSIQYVGNYIIKEEDIENYIDDVIYEHDVDKLSQIKKNI